MKPKATARTRLTPGRHLAAVDPVMRRELVAMAAQRNILAIDTIGSAVDQMSTVFGLTPLGQPGLYHGEEEAYMERIKAIEYTVDHDDGRNPSELHEADVVIEATGFRPFDITDYVNIAGRDGMRLRDVWSNHVESFRTVMVPGFPNFFMLLGPNSATGHTSALIMIESQAKYVLRALKLMERHRLASIDPDPEVVARYNDRLQKDMRKMVFSGGCNSWYTDASDRNFTLWPYSALRFVAEQWNLKRDEFRVKHLPAG